MKKINDGLTKHQRYAKKHPILSFRAEPEIDEILDKIAKKENLSKNKLLYTIVKAFLKEHYAVSIRYNFDV